ncbi:hypothetical protein WT25_16850 [Burkholderia territorii]|uniref:hypothetical protein n=1 Tax=Burkholderia territorii TaxID=1503055 RepID=UPI00075E2013|nr:hypothetical protein [Burkholderia territorii]KVT80421.1 hypothetical protein WT25_16850 [Burkholderia territorii]
MKRRASPPRRLRGQLGKRLSLPREEFTALSLHYHAAFEALRIKQGSGHGARVLLQMVVLTGFIGDARRCELNFDALRAAENALCAAVEHGERIGEWQLDAEAEEVIGALLAWHDNQLRCAPLAVLVEAIERLERLRDGKSYARPPVRVT